MADFRETVKAVAKEFQSLSSSQCQQSLEDLLDKCSQLGEDFPPEGVKAILAFVLSVAALRCGAHRPLQTPCLQLIRQAARAAKACDDAGSKAELHTFFFKLVKKEVKSQPMDKPRIAVLALQYIRQWIVSSGTVKLLEVDTTFTFEVIAGALQALFAEMGRNHNWEPRWKLKASRAVQRILRVCPPAMEHAVSLLKKEGAAPPLVLGTLLAALAGSPEAAQRGLLLDTYVKQVLESKQPPSAFTLEAWRPLLATLSTEEVEKQLLPVATRMCKRNPSCMAASFPAMASQLCCNLSRLAKEFLDPFGPELLKTAERRSGGRVLVQCVAKRCEDAGAALALAEAWAEGAKKAGKADEKQATLMALSILILAIPPKAASDMGATFEEGLRRIADPKGVLAKMAAEDSNEETRVLGYKALGAVLLRLPASSQEAFAPDLLKVLADKKATDRIRVTVLEGLAGASAAHQEGAAWAGGAFEKAMPLFLVASSKPAQRLQTLLAWALCSNLAAPAPDAFGAKVKKEHLAVLRDGKSFVNALDVLCKAPLAELIAQAAISKASLCGHIPGLPSLSAAAESMTSDGSTLVLPPSPFDSVLPTCRTAVALLALLQQAKPEKSGDSMQDQSTAKATPLVQLGICDALHAASVQDAKGLVLLLAQALVAWFAELAAMPSSQRPVNGAALRGALLDLAQAIADQPKSASGEGVALLCLAAHHGLLSTHKWSTSRFWAQLMAVDRVRKLMGDTAPWRPIRDLISAGGRLPASDKTGFRQACIKLAGALRLGSGFADPGSVAAEGLHHEIDEIMKGYGEALPSEALVKEDEKNIAIYFAPEGVLWMEEGTYVAEEREEKNVKQNKFLKELYGDTDLSAEKRPTKPASAKAKAGAVGKAKAKGAAKAAAANSGQMTKSDIEAAQIQEQSETRARIRKLVDEAHYMLDILAALATEGNTHLVVAAVPALMVHFPSLLKSPLTAVRARRTLRIIACLVIDNSDITRKDLVAEALLVVAKGLQGPVGTAADTSACEALLDSVATKEVIHPSSMACILPIVLKILADSTPALDQVCKRALFVLEKQLNLGGEVPELSISDVFESLGVALLSLPSQRTGTQAAMVAASKHLIATEDQLARLAQMFFAENEVVRSAVVAAVAAVQHNANVEEGTLSTAPAHAVLLLGALEPASETVASEALELLELFPDEKVLMELVDYAANKPPLDSAIQELVAKALAQALQEMEDSGLTSQALDKLSQVFREDGEARMAVARCFEKVYGGGCLVEEEQIVKAFRFLLRQALGLTTGGTADAISLRDLLLAAGMSLIEQCGEEHADVLYGTLEEFEDSAAGAAAGESARLGVAVFLGALSKHLGADHPKVPEILPRLLQRLLDKDSTVSVQNAIVKVMPPLMKQNKEQAAETLENLIEKALAPKVEPMTRRGAAMGVGAAVKGLSTQAVSQYQILKKIEAASENKKDASIREGALLCLEGLSLNLGKLFDPYVVASLPLLLAAFADPNRQVQAASQTAAKVMMAQLTGPGVKQVLKPLLEGVKDNQHRTRLGSIELLASMTNCLPKQLSACLPQVVPALCATINDQHNKVKEGARDALNRVGNIITSPELKALAPELINALTHGAQHEHITRDVLDQLLNTSFVHHIDAPSLSLVCPLVQRALKERSGEMKRKGAQIVGSMVLLIKDAKDIQPYLPLLLPQLKETLVDPIPDVRATAAKAFGTLAHELPEDMLGDVLPWLFNMLRSAESAVERSGAAHGLSEVLMAMGVERIEMLLPDILTNATNKEAPAEVKEGYLGLFVYLPVAMGSHFEPHLEEVLTALLDSLSDDSASVRDTGFKAGQVLTKHFGASHTALLLGPLEEGVFDSDWRVRHASVSLMGQLIEQILRANRIPTHSAELMQCDILPKEWRTHMLAMLYIVRSDENHIVKQSCATVWKSVVQNTPKVLKELLPSLMKLIIQNLAATSREKQRVAARCVGDLVSKLGERVMPELMPIFMNTLGMPDAHVREGVCIGLAELINATTKQLLDDYLEELIPAICQAIIDEEESVRNSASIVVSLLHNSVGPRATTDVVNRVLEMWQDAVAEGEEEEGSQLYLQGLEQMLAKQPTAVLPLVISHMTSLEEHSIFQVQGLSAVAVVPDAHTVHTQLSDVLPVMISAASDPESSEELCEVAIASAGRIIDRVEQGGLHLLFPELVSAVQDRSSSTRRSTGAKMVQHFFDSTSLDVVPVLPQALPSVLPPALADEDEGARVAGIGALKSIVNKCKKEELAAYLPQVRDAVLGLITDPVTNQEDRKKLLPGLCKHNGIEPLWPIYQHGLMYGSAEQREQAAKGIGEMVDHTDDVALKPWLTKITGPLIRIVGDKFPGAVKKAILDTLMSLLVKGGVSLKPFLPQLQSTYVKCLADPTEAVRLKAVDSLGTLVKVSGKLETKLVNDLSTAASTATDPAVRQAMCLAFGQVLLNVAQPAAEALQEKLLDTLIPIALEGESRQEREAAAWPLALVLRRHLAPDAAVAQLQEQVLGAVDSDSAEHRHGAALVLAGACWCQQPQLAEPAAELLEPIREATDSWLPGLLSDSDPMILSAGVVLLAGAAKLSAAASLPLDWLRPHAEKAAAALASGKLDPASVTIAVRAVRHYAGVVAASGAASHASCAQLAAALAARGSDTKCEAPELAERALAALLAPARSNGSAAVSESMVKSSVEALAGKLSDDKASRLLRDFALKRLKSLAQAAGDSDFVWDF